MSVTIQKREWKQNAEYGVQTAVQGLQLIWLGVHPLVYEKTVQDSDNRREEGFMGHYDKEVKISAILIHAFEDSSRDLLHLLLRPFLVRNHHRNGC